jgi:hypothetical protein
MLARISSAVVVQTNRFGSEPLRLWLRREQRRTNLNNATAGIVGDPPRAVKVSFRRSEFLIGPDKHGEGTFPVP